MTTAASTRSFDAVGRWSWRTAVVLLMAGSAAATAFAGAPAPPADVTTIPAIQGRGAASPLAGRQLISEGAVTRVDDNGFFLQDPAGDGDPRTSDAIFVFTGNAPGVAPGQCRLVEGRVVEFAAGAATPTPSGPAAPGVHTVTELHDPAPPRLLGEGCAVAPVDLVLPLRAGDSLARFEGMLVTLHGPLTVQQNFFLGRFGQLTLAVGGRVEAPTHRLAPGAAAQALAVADARRMVLLDDGSARLAHPKPGERPSSRKTGRCGPCGTARRRSPA